MTAQSIKQPALFKQVFGSLIKDVNTAIPGHVLSFNPSNQLAVVQIGIERVDLNGSTTACPPIAEVPVHFAGGDYALEFEIKPGCEGVIQFSQRCIDGWLQSGGVAPNPFSRFHDKSDAMFIPGVRSIKGAITGFQNNGARLRNADGTQQVWLKNDGSIVLQNSAGIFELEAGGNVKINGVTITTDGDVVTSDGISLRNHRTSGVTPGVGISGGPVI